MEFYKQARFWITVLAMGVVAGLAFLGRVQGSEALSALLGVAGGWALSGKDAR